MNKLLVFATLLVATTATAHADKQKALADLGGLLSNYMTWTAQPWSDGASGLPRYLAEPSCESLVANARKGGATDADVIRGSGFAKHPKATKVGNSYEISVGDVGWVCEQWNAKLAAEPAAVFIRRAHDYKRNRPTPPTAEMASGFNVGSGEASVTRGRECLAAIDARVAAGASLDEPVMLADRSTIELAAGRALCEYSVQHGQAFEALVVAAHKAKRDQIAVKYIERGVKGARLDLFVEYDGVYWRGKGCEIVDDVGKVVKAKVLFHWLENADGTHTIRKYTFKGDTYKTSEKTYLTETRAYAGCK